MVEGCCVFIVARKSRFWDFGGALYNEKKKEGWEREKEGPWEGRKIRQNGKERWKEEKKVVSAIRTSCCSQIRRVKREGEI